MGWTLIGIAAALAVAGAVETLMAKDEDVRTVTVGRYDDHVIAAMTARGETWVWVVARGRLMDLSRVMSRQVRRKNSLTADDAVAVCNAIGRLISDMRGSSGTILKF